MLRTWYYCDFLGHFRNRGLCLNESEKKLYALRNKYKGQRCFLIGNGPSICEKDLLMLANEITFGCNKIHKMTEFKPTFFGCIDREVTEVAGKEMFEANHYYFTSRFCLKALREQGIDEGQIILSRYKWIRDDFPRDDEGRVVQLISGNIMNYTYPITASVIVYLYELAFWMGFSDIYLVGVDMTLEVGKVEHFDKGYFSEQEMSEVDKKLVEVLELYGYSSVHEMSEQSFNAIQKHAQEHNINIVNCTRGGDLNIFERKTLEEVLM